MAKGYPDFFGFSMFPYYGTTFRDDDSSVITPLNNETLISLTMKGIIRGGYIVVSLPATLNTTLISVSIDGESVEIIAAPLGDTADASLDLRLPLVSVNRSLVLAQHIFAITGDWSFQDSFVITGQNTEPAGNVNVVTRVYYNRIET